MENRSLKPNPFSNTRVDTPFQNHIDLKEIYQTEFQRLNSVIDDIKDDVENHQSKGAVVIGDPGTGKTHLMMRLAKERLQSNRLLFIRQPNNIQSVLYHIYSRVLESLVEKVPNSPYSQLEYLLATSFSKIIVETFREFRNKKRAAGILEYFRKLTDKDRYLLELLSKNPLNLYKDLGREGARTKREYWQRIEMLLDGWWKKNYGDAGNCTDILKGIVQFCRYSEPNKKRLVGKWLSAGELDADEIEKIGLKNWKEESNKEAFSLDAMIVFGKLSIMDEPLIIIFDQLEGLGLEYNKELLHSFGDTVKELFTYVPNSLMIFNLFPDRWEYFKNVFDGSVIGRISQCQISLYKPSEEQLQKLLVLKGQTQGVDIEQLFNDNDLGDIFSQTSIREVLNRASHYYRFRMQNIPLPKTATAIETVIEKVPPPTVKSFEEEVKEQLEMIRSQLKESNKESNFEEEMKETLRLIMVEIATLRRLMESTLIKPMTSIIESMPIIQHQAMSTETLTPSVSGLIIEYLEREKPLLEEHYDKLVIISDSDDVGKLLTVTEAFNLFSQNIETENLKLGQKKLPEHLLIKTPKQSYVIGFLQVSDMGFPARIKNFNELLTQYPEIQFTLFRDVRETMITGKAGKTGIDKLNNAPNGQFIYMDKEDRLTFELIYKLIVDIQNKDFEADLKQALKTLDSLMSHYWLIKIFK
jgi:GTPase SAR1 family protein